MSGQALANHKTRGDVRADAEITARFNLESDWYFGTDGNHGVASDFVTVVLHEIGHGLNFYHTILTNGTYVDSSPGIYDSFLSDQHGTRLTLVTDDQRAAAIISDNLFWDGDYAKAALDGARPRIFAPTQYKDGSSVSHLDEAEYPATLMTPYIDESVHSLTPMELGMLRDLGWTLMINPPAAAVPVGTAQEPVRTLVPSASQQFSWARQNDGRNQLTMAMAWHIQGFDGRDERLKPRPNRTPIEVARLSTGQSHGRCEIVDLAPCQVDRLFAE
jgi:hypothetical protein